MPDLSPKYEWSEGLTRGSSIAYSCSHCGAKTTPRLTWGATVTLRESIGGRVRDQAHTSSIFICTGCGRPTWWDPVSHRFMPSPKLGATLKRLPPKVGELYDEARDCAAAGAFTACTMLARKLLMNLAVHEGAGGNLQFAKYVDYLVDKGHVPPKGRVWVSKIKDKGNEANHELPSVTQGDAAEIMMLTEMLLRFNYELGDPNEEA